MSTEVAPPEEPERPRAVAVIGWIWIVVGGLYSLRGLIDLMVWGALYPAAPTLLRSVERHDSSDRLLRFVFEHLTVIKISQAVLGVVIVVLAWRFLRLGPGARVAMQVLCWIVLGFVVAFTVFLAALSTRAVAVGVPAPRLGSQDPLGLAVALGVAAAIAAGLIWMIATLRRAEVRQAFESSRRIRPV